MDGGGVRAGELRGEAWVGRGGGAGRFVPPARQPGVTSVPPSPRTFWRIFLHLITVSPLDASLLGCLYKYILH